MESSDQNCSKHSAVCFPLWSQASRCVSHRGVKLCGVAPQCASHSGVQWSKLLKTLRGVHPTAESSSVVCITPRSQIAHCRVKIEIFVSLQLLLKGQSGEILLGANTSIIRENSIKVWKSGLTKLKILTPGCHAHRGVEIFKLCDRISKLNSKILMFIYQGPGWVHIMKKMEVKNLVTHSL